MAQHIDPPITDGQEMMLWCVGGRSMMRRVSFPPPIEIEDDGGIYVLNDEATNPANWQYVFVGS